MEKKDKRVLKFIFQLLNAALVIILHYTIGFQLTVYVCMVLILTKLDKMDLL